MSDGFSSVFHLVGLYSNKLTSGHKANGHIWQLSSTSDSIALELCLERENNPYVDVDWKILFVYIDCEMCLSCSYVDEIVVQKFQSVQKFSAFFLNTIIFVSLRVLRCCIRHFVCTWNILVKIELFDWKKGIKNLPHQKTKYLQRIYFHRSSGTEFAQ